MEKKEKKWKPEFEEAIDFEYPDLNPGDFSNGTHSSGLLQPVSERYEVPGILPKAPPLPDDNFLP